MPTKPVITLDEQVEQYSATQEAFMKKVDDAFQPYRDASPEEPGIINVLKDVAKTQNENLAEAAGLIQQLQLMTTKILSGDERSHHMQPNSLASAKDLLAAMKETSEGFHTYKAQIKTTLLPADFFDKEYNALTAEFKALEKRFHENYPDAKKALFKKTNQEPGAIEVFQKLKDCQDLVDKYIVDFRSIQQSCQDLVTEIEANILKSKTAADNLGKQIASKEKVTKATLPSGSRNAFLANSATVAPEPTGAEPKKGDDEPTGPCSGCTLM